MNAQEKKERRDADTAEMIHAINANALRRSAEREIENIMIERAVNEKRARRAQTANEILAGMLLTTLIMAFAAFMWARTDALAAGMMVCGG